MMVFERTREGEKFYLPKTVKYVNSFGLSSSRVLNVI